MSDKILDLNEENFLIQCARQYKPAYRSTSEEFLADIKKIKYIKKLLTRYKTYGKIDERLVLNHLITLNNIFGPQFLCRVLYLKLSNYFEYLKPFLLYLGVLPDVIVAVNGRNTITVYLKMNEEIMIKLKDLHNKEIKPII